MGTEVEEEEEEGEEEEEDIRRKRSSSSSRRGTGPPERANTFGIAFDPMAHVFAPAATLPLGPLPSTACGTEGGVRGGRQRAGRRTFWGSEC
eukprot:6215749-Pyramimonas_sp.AAC.1